MVRFTYISKSTAKKLLKEAGAKRVSKSGLDAFQIRMNKIGLSVASKAVRMAKHAKRKTVEVSDIKIAFSDGI
jgi:DNA-binding protein